MTETHYIGIIGSTLMVLVGLVGWIGTRIFNKLDSLSAQMTENMISIQKQIADGDNILHGRVSEIDRRVTRIETRCSIHLVGK